MVESIKSVCSLVFIVAAIATFFLWIKERPDQATWIARVVAPIVGLAAIGLLLKLHFRPDLAPDYLKALSGTYFNRDGFAFALSANPVDGVCMLTAHFMNQYDRPCTGCIAVRPGKGFWLNRAEIPTLTYQIPCDPGAFGVARIAIPVPLNLQGKAQRFEVGASVKYPSGKGKRLRFHDGLFLRTNANFGNAFGTALAVAGALTFTVVISKPAECKILLPTGVAESLPDDMPSQVKTIWQLGDPPLQI